MSLGANTLYLMPEVKAHFFRFLKTGFPELLDGYLRLYGGAYVPEGYKARVLDRVDELRDRYGLSRKPRPRRQVPRQLAPKL